MQTMTEPDRLTRRSFVSTVAGVEAIGASGGLHPAQAIGAQFQRLRQATPSADLTVEPGETASLEIPVEVAEKQPVPEVDVLFCFDLTGSMEEEIQTVTDRAQQIADDLEARDLKPAFGVSGFKDYPDDYQSYGYEADYGAETDYAWRVHQQITDNVGTFEDALGALSIGDGKDEPENYARALYEVQKSAIGWRTNALRTVVLFGDSIPHDDDFHEEADEWGSYVDSSTGGDPGRDQELFTGDDLDFQEVVESLNIPIICVNSGEFTASWKYIADQTGGAYFDLVDAKRIPETVVELVGGEANTVTLTLAPEVGFDSWFSWAPSEVTAVAAGSTTSFEVTCTPPADATLGTKTITLYAVADGSRIETYPIRMNVVGTTDGPVPVANLSGSGPKVEARLARYEWYRKSFQRDFWLSEGTKKLEYFRTDFQSGLTDLESVLVDVVGEAAGAGYYADAALAAKETVTLSGTLKAWGIGEIENRARANIPPARRERIGVDSPAAQVESIESLLRSAATDSAQSQTSKREKAIEALDSLLAYFRAWRTEIDQIEIEPEYKATMDTSEQSFTLEPDSGAAETVEFTAGPHPGSVSWHLDENGWLPHGGTYEVTVSVVGGGEDSVQSGRHSSGIRLLGSTSFATPEKGDTVRVTVEVVEPPTTLVYDWISRVTEIDVDVTLHYNFDLVREESDDSTFQDLTESTRKATKKDALKHISSAIAFFQGERSLLTPENMAGAKVASPVDIHVEGEEGHLGVRSETDEPVIETSLSADYLYSGPESHPEGVLLVDADGEFDMRVRGRGTGTYDLSLVTAEVSADGLAVDSVEEVRGVPVEDGAVHDFSVDISKEDGSQMVAADLDTVRAEQSATSGDPTVPLSVTNLPPWTGPVGLGTAILLGLKVWTTYQDRTDDPGVRRRNE